MVEQILLSLAWLGGNFLDGLTTYLGIFKVPPELRGKELNPLARRFIYTHFGKTVWVKGFVSILLLACLWLLFDPTSRLFSLKILSIIMGFVVLNNSYIYISKKIRKKIVMTPGLFLTRTCHLPGGLAYMVMVGLIGLASYSIASIIWAQMGEIIRFIIEEVGWKLVWASATHFISSGLVGWLVYSLTLTILSRSSFGDSGIHKLQMGESGMRRFSFYLALLFAVYFHLLEDYTLNWFW